MKDPDLRLSRDQEKKRYLLHDNSLEHSGYVTFLNELLEPLQSFLSKGQQGLDFGCGPIEAAATLLQKEDLCVESYDPFFFPKEDVLKKQYDFLIASEVVEHFYDARKSWELMISLLKEKGILALRTSPFDMREGWKENLLNWHYAKDPTHVSFISEKFLGRISFHFNLKPLTFLAPSIWFFQKQAS